MSELDDLRAAVRDLLGAHAPVRSAVDEGSGPAVWQRLAVEMGLAALPAEDVPLEWVAAVTEETGRVLLRAPWTATAVAAASLARLGRTADVPGLLDGTTTAALALDGRLDQVPHAGTAGVLLLARGDDLHAVTDFSAVPVTTLDLTRSYADVTVGDPGPVVGPAGPARDLEQLLCAAECVGGTEALIALTVEHLLVREQFGRPLGSFQALRHRVADLTVLLEAAASSTWYAARCDDDELPVAAPLALAAATEAFTEAAGECLQLFGGIGFTWEHDAHLYFRRAWTVALRHGDPRALRTLAFDRSGT